MRANAHLVPAGGKHRPFQIGAEKTRRAHKVEQVIGLAAMPPGFRTNWMNSGGS